MRAEWRPYVRCVTSYLSQMIGKDKRGFTYFNELQWIQGYTYNSTLFVHLHSNCFIVHQVFIPKTGSVPGMIASPFACITVKTRLRTTGLDG